jgi:hypothetical protein
VFGRLLANGSTGGRGTHIADGEEWAAARAHPDFQWLREGIWLGRLLDDLACEAMNLANQGSRTAAEDEALHRATKTIRTAVNQLARCRAQLHQTPDGRPEWDAYLEREYSLIAGQVIPGLRKTLIARAKGKSPTLAMLKAIVDEQFDGSGASITVTIGERRYKLPQVFNLGVFADPRAGKVLLRLFDPSLGATIPEVARELIASANEGETAHTVRHAITRARKAATQKRRKSRTT